MEQESKLTPETIFIELDKAQHDINVGLKVVANFSRLPNKVDFLDPTIKFVEVETEDRIRSWGMNLLEMIGGDKSFEAAIGIFKEEDIQDIKRQYLYTRFFALRAALRLAGEDEKKKRRVEELCTKLWQDEEEDYLVRSAAAIQLALRRQKEPKAWLVTMLADYFDFYPILRALRALKEFPLDDLSDDVIKVIVNSRYLDHKFIAIKALGGFTNNISVLRALGNVVTTEPDEYLRLNAINSLERLQDSRAKDDLLHALEEDSNAEVRLRAAMVLNAILGTHDAVGAIINSALRPEIDPHNLTHLIDSLRQVDPNRAISSELLSDEIESPDQRRAKQAEKILIELGGWAAVTRLNQRRRNLEKLDEFLKKSEETVTKNYQNTMMQAQFGFYFAMAVNVLIVVIGLVLILIALQHLIQNPEDLTAWILPGATGVLGILLNLFFNNPRNNAREDMATLLNISVIFQGYLEELHHIDATFKHMYIENRDFGTDEMEKTVEGIKTAAEKTLEQVKNNLYISPVMKKET